MPSAEVALLMLLAFLLLVRTTKIQTIIDLISEFKRDGPQSRIVLRRRSRD